MKLSAEDLARALAKDPDKPDIYVLLEEPPTPPPANAVDVDVAGADDFERA